MSTLSVSPSAGAVSPCDGPINSVSRDQTFSAIQSGPGNQGGLTSVSSDTAIGLQASTTSNQFQNLRRSFYNFDTSSIGSGATITAATFKLKTNFKENGLGNNGISICAATPASTSALPNTDFVNVGTTEFATVAYSGITTGSYTDFALNSSGLAAINKTGITSLAARLKWDMDAAFGGVWASNGHTRYNAYYADDATSTNRPVLEVTYSTGGGPSVTSQFFHFS